MRFQRIRNATPEMIAAARRLRQQPTPTEKLLWNAINKRQLKGLRFRFQHPISSFVVDFYCPKHRLIIELDGVIHDQQVEYDQARTEQLQQLGYRVIRFRNSEVSQNLAKVLQTILAATETL